MNIDDFNEETIDIYREDTGDFLDLDLNIYKKKAYEAYKSGDYEKAVRYYMLTLSYDIKNASSIYNLACCYGLLGKDILAANYLRRAVKAGYKNIEKIRSDADFENVRGQKAFDTMVENLISEIEEERKQQGETLYIDNSALFRCCIHLPENYNSKKDYTLLIGLHGGGGRCEDFIKLREHFEHPEFIYAVPQAPYPWVLDREIGYDWALWPTGDEVLMERAKKKLNEYIVNIVHDLRNLYKIKKIYLMGHSQGTIFTYTTGINNSSLFKGLIILSGVGIYKSIPSPSGKMVDIEWPSEDSFEVSNKLKIFIAHSKEDKVLKYEFGTQSRDVLTKYGYDVTFCDFEGNHSVSSEVLKKVEDWME